MDVFISWSGKPSRSVATALSKYLKLVFAGAIEVKISTEWEGGVQWGGKLTAQLGACDFGIICVTPQNQREPFLNFEAGAIAKKVNEGSRCVPLAIGMDPSDVVPPIGLFQARQADKNGLWSLVTDINDQLQDAAEELAMLEERSAPFLEPVIEAVRAASSGNAEDQVPHRDVADMVGEVLTLVRGLHQSASFSALEAEPGSARLAAANSIIGRHRRALAGSGRYDVSDILADLLGPTDPRARPGIDPELQRRVLQKLVVDAPDEDGERPATAE